MPEITREEVREDLRRTAEAWERRIEWYADQAAHGDRVAAQVAASTRKTAAIYRLALAALEDAERWAPKPRERYVRVADELVEQLRAAPSAPVTLQIRDEPDGTLMFVCTSAAIDRARGV